MPVLVKQAAFTIRIEARHAAKSTKSNAVGNWECWHCRGKLNWIVYSSNLVCSRTWFGTNPLWLVTTRSVASNQSRMFTVSLPRTISTTFLKSVRTHRPHKITQALTHFLRQEAWECAQRQQKRQQWHGICLICLRMCADLMDKTGRRAIGFMTQWRISRKWENDNSSGLTLTI